MSTCLTLYDEFSNLKGDYILYNITLSNRDYGYRYHL